MQALECYHGIFNTLILLSQLFILSQFRIFENFSVLISKSSALSDWDETLDWIESYNNDIFTDKTSYDKNYLLALNAFDLGDFDSVASHLEKVS